jgi:uncharacterized protein YbjT (DUF2867 family)
VILVVGGHSKIGSALLELLSARGEESRALARAGEAGFPEGVEAVAGDLGDPRSLREAMTGVDSVFLLSSPHADAVEWHRNAIDAARDAGVSSVVRSSILGADADSPSVFLSSHGESDAYLEQSGVDYTILRPNMFMQNVPESTIPSIDGDGRFYGDAGDARISMVDTRDVAAVASVVLTESGHGGARYDLTGPEALSYHDVAAKLSAAMGRGISYVAVPDDAVRTALLGYGMDVWLVDALVGLFAEYRRSGTDGYAAAVSGDVERITGQPPRSLDQMLAELQPAA